MQWLVNLVRGWVTVEIWGAFPERLLNLCAQNGLGFWDLEWVDETTFRFTVPFQSYRRLKELAQRAMCEVRSPRWMGLPRLARDLSRRRCFVGGMLLCLLTLVVLSRFVLVVEVVGNEQVPSAIILEELARQGLRAGTYGPSVEARELSNRAMIHLEGLSFLAVNLYGCRAEVQVREADPQPELLDQSVPADIVSTVSGIITELVVTSGQALFQEGETVLEGETIITGFMDLPEVTFSETDAGIYVVRATGQVWARTWRTLRAELPLTAQVKSYTGRSQSRFAVRFLDSRLNFYKSWETTGIYPGGYDKIIQLYPLSLPGGVTLPLTLVQETVREYDTAPAELDQEAAIVLLEEDLRRDLDDILQETDGECLRTDYTAVVEDGMLTVTLLAECHEQIGKTVEREGEVGFIPGEGGAAG